MHRLIPSSVFAALLAAFVLTFGNWGTAVAGGDKLSSDTRKELAQARRATAKYHNISNAIVPGGMYLNISFITPSVGCHLLNPALLADDGFKLERPEALVYSDCSGELGGRSELRALEYIVVCGPAILACEGVDPPEGFSGDDDVWEVFIDSVNDLSLWTLHVWVWRHNPDGIFVKPNPRIVD